MIRVVRGMHCFVESADYSRLHQGFAAAGPQDRFSCELANRLLGNQTGDGAIEFTLAPAVVVVTQACRFVIGGADCEIKLDGVLQPDWTVLQAPAGGELRITICEPGCRVYLCIAGGVDPEGMYTGDPHAAKIGRARPTHLIRWEPSLGSIRILPGPEMSSGIANTLTKGGWTVGPQSNAIGLRLSGSAFTLPSYDIQSAPTQDGTVQATQTGLIALLRNRGTLGGYPRVATVIDCDVDRLAQFRPGQQIRFQFVHEAEARRLYGLQQRALEQVATG